MEGLPYFTNYLEIVFDLYVLVTTANSPDVMYVCMRDIPSLKIWYLLLWKNVECGNGTLISLFPIS